MKLIFDPLAREQLVYCQETDCAKLRRTNTLIKDCLRHPFEGIDKPEPLKSDLAGFWSRRIDRDHRLVYRVTHEALEIVWCHSVDRP